MCGVKYWEENCWASKSLKLWSPLTFRPGWQVQSFQVTRLSKTYLDVFCIVKNVNKNQCMHRKIKLWYKCCTHSPVQSEPCVFDRSITLWTRRNPSGADPSWKMRNKLLSPPHIYSSITRTWENVEQMWRRKKLFFSSGTWGMRRATQDNAELKGWHLRLFDKWD